MKIDFSVTREDAERTIKRASPTRVFAWLPKKMGYGHWRWLEYVWRESDRLGTMQREFLDGDYEWMVRTFCHSSWKYESIE